MHADVFSLDTNTNYVNANKTAVDVCRHAATTSAIKHRSYQPRKKQHLETD